LRATYIERIVRLGFGLLASALLLTALLQLTPGAPADPGISMRTARPVAELVGPSLTLTLKSLAVGLAYALPLALLLGIPAGLKPHSLLDRLLQAPAVALMGVPAAVGALLVIGSLALHGPALSIPGATQVALLLMLAAWVARAVRNGLADSRTDGAPRPWGKAVLLALGRVLQQTGNLLVITMVVTVAGGGTGRSIWGLVVQGVSGRDLPVVYAALWAIIPLVLVGHLAGDLLVTAVAGDGERPAGRISRSWLVIGGLLMALLLIMPGLGGGQSPEAMDIIQRNLPPGPGHPLGTDHLGRDLLARAAAGTRVSLTISAAATLLALLPAAALATAGWAMGSWGMAVLTPRTAVPNLFGPLAAGLLGALIFRPSVAILILFLGLASIPSMAMAFRQLYQPGRTVAPVQRALPALFGVLLLTLAQNLLAETTLSAMGFGVQPPMASLGHLVGASMAYLRAAPQGFWATLPGLAGIVGLCLVGHGLAGAGRENV
jgi:peptide/nickel transport system permease protein